jgi:hypothetical protein
MSTAEPAGSEPEPSEEPETSGDTDEVETERRNGTSTRKKLVGVAAAGLVWGGAEAIGVSVAEQMLDWVFAVLPSL